MAPSTYFLLASLLALATSQATASDPSPLQDFCVADIHSPVKVNGFVCKDPMAVNADDFFKAANLDKPRDTMKSKVGSNVTLINVMQLPGLNTLGISLARIDYAPLGQNPPHTHPRATEILTVLEGTLYVGFVTSNTDNGNKLFAKVLNKGDVFVFPQGLIHFQFNPVHDKPAVAIAALSSQNPGAITIANAVFGSKPPISDDVLAKAFQVQKEQLIGSKLNSGRTTTTKITFKRIISMTLPPKNTNEKKEYAFQRDPIGFASVMRVKIHIKTKLPGLNTLGISLARIDYAPLGQNPPHTHPRAIEILTVLEGTLYVGFVTSNTDNGNKLFTKVLNKGEVFVFPQGLIPFQFNPIHDKPAVAIAALSSQNPGAITIANAVLGSKPPISDDVLAKAFQVQKGKIDWLQAQFWENNHY
ncbi:unnamed protein product [Miscanthus lutarioriparius]|uniref:Cupin type-1 domain-containing protein n=1 Tax=Miscanthus lutarioriparius TaxID=422564 RepID=A0A811R7E0_9POAL|nr:unnamed protein product [Miscanthus lutarioriparius]